MLGGVDSPEWLLALIGHVAEYEDSHRSTVDPSVECFSAELRSVPVVEKVAAQTYWRFQDRLVDESEGSSDER